MTAPRPRATIVTRDAPAPAPRSRPRARGILRPTFPFNPARSPFFYGWVVLVMSVLGVVMSVPGQTMGVSVFTDSLIAAFGITRLELSNAYLVGTLTSSLFIPFGGRLLDRFGARILVIASSLALASTLVYLSVSDHLARGLSAALGVADAKLVAIPVLVLGFTVLRFSGQGMLTMVSQTMLSKWFARRRGLAAGIAGVMKSFAFGTAPLVLAGLVAGAGWRGAWVLLAVVVGGGMSVLGWLFFRDNPEECGLEMDGDAAEPVEDVDRPKRVAERAFTRGEALRTLGFWSVTLALAFHALVITGVTFHIVSIGADAGLGVKEAVSVFLPLALVSTLTGILAGIASDRARIRYLLATMMLFQALGLFSMTAFASPGWRVLAILGLGVSGGFFGVLSTVAFPRWFGRKHLGAINGVQMSAMVVGSAIGPSVLALSHGTTGTYHAGFIAFLALPGLILMLAPFTRNPQEREAESVAAP